MNTLSAPFISSRPRPRLHGALGAALGAVVAGLVLTGGQVKAMTFTVNNQDYDVTTFTGTYDDNVIKFTTTDMPWWGDGTLASQFASAVGSSSGLPGNARDIGPLFAFSPGGQNNAYIWYFDGTPGPGESSIKTALTSRNFTSWTYAVLASSAPADPTASVPGPLPILGLAAAFGFSRKLRKRIKSSTNTLPSSSAS